MLCHPPHVVLLFFFFLLIPPPPTSTLFPYTTLFRSDPRITAHVLRPLRVPEQVRIVALLPDEDEMGSRHERSEEHTSELQSRRDLVCRLLLEKKKKKYKEQLILNHNIKTKTTPSNVR